MNAPQRKDLGFIPPTNVLEAWMRDVSAALAAQTANIAATKALIEALIAKLIDDSVLPPGWEP